MMMRHLIYGIKRLGLHLKEFSDLAKKIISGNMVLVHVVHVQRFIMTEAKSTDAASRAVQ